MKLEIIKRLKCCLFVVKFYKYFENIYTWAESSFRISNFSFVTQSIFELKLVHRFILYLYLEFGLVNVYT